MPGGNHQRSHLEHIGQVHFGAMLDQDFHGFGVTGQGLR